MTGPPAADSPPGTVRRPPYGRNPELAALGVRARDEIVAAARDLFTHNGYQATTVESIGEATGRSGAAVYQYFEGKAEIFSIFLREAGIDLIAAGDQFPVLSDDAAGDAALQAWISDLMDVFTRHRGAFLLWSQVQFVEPTLAAVGHDNLNIFQTAIIDRLVKSGAHPPTPSIVPIGILSVVQWSYFMYSARAPRLDRRRLEQAVAVTLRAFLFAPPGSPVRWPVAGKEGELPSIPLSGTLGLRRPLTARGVGTVQRILFAAAERFRGNGYYGTSLSDIAAAAGVSHGSVYTYWSDRDALFATLAADAVAAVELRVEALPAALLTADGVGDWLAGWVSMLDAHGAVLYVWTHEVDIPDLDALTARMNRAVSAAASAFITASGRAQHQDPEAMQIMLRAALTDVPYVLSTQLGILERDAAYAFVAGLLRAGIGAPVTQVPEPRGLDS